MLYIDRMGRKPALAIGALGMGLCHFIIAVIFARNENKWETEQASAWACIVMVWLFVVCTPSHPPLILLPRLSS